MVLSMNICDNEFAFVAFCGFAIIVQCWFDFVLVSQGCVWI